MSGWHREHPDLAGTDADPWMQNPGYATAAREVRMYTQFPDLDAMIAQAEADSTHECRECGEVQCDPPNGACRECGEPVVEREP